MALERLQKYLARQGLGSRREIEEWIRGGRVRIDDKVATLGDKVALSHRIYLDNKRLVFNQVLIPTRVLLYHKPIGEISTRKDPAGRETIFSGLPELEHGRWVNVGRLDFNTSGLLLFTTDGELAFRLMHPRYQIEREYAVRVQGLMTPEIRQQLLQGVKLSDGYAHFAKIIEGGGEGSNRWYAVTVKEGRYRMVRRLLQAQNLTVNRLIRTRLGPILLPRDSKPGEYRELSSQDIARLRNLLVNSSDAS